MQSACLKGASFGSRQTYSISCSGESQADHIGQLQTTVLLAAHGFAGLPGTIRQLCSMVRHPPRSQNISPFFCGFATGSWAVRSGLVGRGVSRLAAGLLDVIFLHVLSSPTS